MASVRPSRFQLPKGALWTLCPPLAVMLASCFLVWVFGTPSETAPVPPRAGGHAEAAGRLRMLATWLFLVAMAVGCLCYSYTTVRSLAADTARRLGIAFFCLALAGIIIVGAGLIVGGPRFIGPIEICRAFGAELPGSAGPFTLRAWLDLGPDCPAQLFQVLWWLNEVQKILLVLLMAALGLGTISCLALPPSPTGADCRFQARRLKTFLYLTAAALVAGLLFLSALLRWPGAGLSGGAAALYKDHVDAYVLYWGITYSIFIASYYVPVAVALARACESGMNAEAAAEADAAAEASEDEASEGNGESLGHDTPVGQLFDLLKTLAALFAPALAGLLGGVMSL